MGGEDGAARTNRNFHGKRSRQYRSDYTQRPLMPGPVQMHQAPQLDHWQPNSSDTMVHFHKSFGVMQEIFEHRDFTNLGRDLHQCTVDHTPPGVVPSPSFLDLGCAPGGFSACLLQDTFLGPNSVGYGVSLPPHLGGFQMMYASDRLFVQLEDILMLQKTDLLCMDNSVDLCLGDAQYLSCLFKNKQAPVRPQQQYRGIKVKAKALGIWALTVKECALAFAKLRHSGSFIFRFGWRGIGGEDASKHPTGEQVHPALLEKYLQEEEWYKALTHWLFSILKSLFHNMKPFKSEYVHQADVSFYMVCRNFDRKKYELHNWEAKLQRAFEELGDCEDQASLVANIKNQISKSAQAEIDDLLEVVGRMRAIGIESRKVTNPTSYRRKFEEAPKTVEEKTKENGSEEAHPKSTDEKLEQTDEKFEQTEAKEAATMVSSTPDNGLVSTSNDATKAEPNEADAVEVAASAAPVPVPPQLSDASTAASSCNVSDASLPQAAGAPSTTVAAPAPAQLSDASTAAESCSASSSSMPQASEISNGSVPQHRDRAAKADAKVEPVPPSIKKEEKSNNEDASASSIAKTIAKGSAHSLGGTSVAGGSASSSGGTKGSGRKAAGRSMRKPPWEGAAWPAQMPHGYGFDGGRIPMPSGDWGNASPYYAMPQQVVNPAVIETAAFAAMQAEENYRRQMHFNMFQSRLNEQQQIHIEEQGGLSVDALHGNTYPDQFHQWSQNAMPQDTGLQQVSLAHHLEGLQTADCPEWSPDVISERADADAFTWMPQRSPEECMPAPSSEIHTRDVLEISRHLHDVGSQLSWPHAINGWSAMPATGHELGHQVLGADVSTPAVGSSSPAVDLSLPPALSSKVGSDSYCLPPAEDEGKSLKTAQPAPAACASSLPLVDVWPSLLSQPTKRRQSATTPAEPEDVPNNPDSDRSGSSDDDTDHRGSHRRGYRHKRRAGRMVRERRNGRRKRTGFFDRGFYGGDRDGTSLLLKLKLHRGELDGLKEHAPLINRSLAEGADTSPS